MKATLLYGRRDVRCEEVAEPKIQKPTDAIIRLSAAVEFDGEQLFYAQRGLMGGPAPVRRFLPHLMELVAERRINPGKVFDLSLPLADAAEGYRAMDERRAIKTMLRV
jgi:threonine dehydrogenase-like Zn-dependent dehydrogenase